MLRYRMAGTLLASLKKNWFLVGIFVVIIAAYFKPEIGKKHGPLKPEITIKYLAVSIIFFNSGLSLKTEQLFTAVKQFKIHMFIQSYTFLFTPTFIFCLVKVLYLTDVNTHLLKGLTVLSCMPPPVSSAVILTKAVGGNEAAAIFNSAFGSFLGIFTSPVLLLFMMGNSADVPFMSVIKTLSCTVVLPILLGQRVRRIDSVKNWLEATQPPFGQIGSGILLAIIYATFCDTFGSGNLNVDLYSLVCIILIVITLQLFGIWFTFTTAKKLGYYKADDIVCIMFCATHKSLTLGIPMLKIVYHGNPALSFLSIPLLVYHPTQILLGGLLVPKIQAWLAEERKIEGYERLPKDVEAIN